MRKTAGFWGTLEAVRIDAPKHSPEERRLMGAVDCQKGKTITIVLRGCGVIDAAWFGEQLGYVVELKCSGDNVSRMKPNNADA